MRDKRGGIALGGRDDKLVERRQKKRGERSEERGEERRRRSVSV